jgi:hypothetical protein
MEILELIVATQNEQDAQNCENWTVQFDKPTGPVLSRRRRSENNDNSRSYDDG